MGAVQFYLNCQMHVGVAGSYRGAAGAAVPGDAQGAGCEPRAGQGAAGSTAGSRDRDPRSSAGATGQSWDRESCGTLRTGTRAGGTMNLWLQRLLRELQPKSAANPSEESPKKEASDTYLEPLSPPCNNHVIRYS